MITLSAQRFSRFQARWVASLGITASLGIALLLQNTPLVAQDPSGLPGGPPVIPGASNTPAGEGTTDDGNEETKQDVTPEEAIRHFKESNSPQAVEEGMKILNDFETNAAALNKTVLEMRRHFTLLANGYTEDKQHYYDLRNEARRLMNVTYDHALDVILFMGHPHAFRFVVHTVESRHKHDIYDVKTLEGAAKLLDAGVHFRYIAQAAARSAMAVGDFDLAERIYDKLSDEELEDKDRALIGQMEILRTQFEHEKKLLENDPKDLPQVRFETTRGEIVANLYIDQAPSTVAHFIQLVESGFYDGLDFFQVLDGVLAMTGDPLGDGSSRPDQFILDEHTRETIRMPLAGSLIMAKLPDGRGGFVPNSGGTQFSMLFLPLPKFSESQTVFGRVIKGMDVLGSFRRVDPMKEKKKNEVVAPPDRVISAEIINRPETLPQALYVGGTGSHP